MEVMMNVSADASSFSAQGGFTMTHADFGMEPFSFPPFVAAFKNGPKLTFGIAVKGSPS